MWPDVPFCSTGRGSMWPSMARNLRSLASRLAIRVSFGPQCSNDRGPSRDHSLGQLPGSMWAK
jgi:hypothetical protein